MLSLATVAACLTERRPVSIWASIVLRMLPFSSSAFSLALLVKSESHWIACDLELLCEGIARVEPPRKPGIGLPATWLGITNCFVAFAYFFPVQHVYQA